MKHTDVEARALKEADRTGQAAQKGESGDWAHAPERSNMLALRFIVMMALVCGRHVTRLLLPPIALYFLLFLSLIHI